MNLTNAQRADLIDALGRACVYAQIEIEMVDFEAGFEPSVRERERKAELQAQIRRFTALRKLYLAEERATRPAKVRRG